MNIFSENRLIYELYDYIIQLNTKKKHCSDNRNTNKKGVYKIGELKSLVNAIEVLELFKKKSSWGVREVSRELDIGATVVHRILATFEKMNYLVVNEKTKQYEIGYKMQEFSLIFKESISFVDIVKPYMKELSNKVGETTFLTWRDGLYGKSIAVEESTAHSIRFVFDVGSRRLLHAGASNLVILAFVPEEDLDRLIEEKLVKFTDDTPMTKEEILQRLKVIRKQGWFHTFGEATADVTGIAVPIFDSRNEVMGSFTIAGPTYRLHEGVIQEKLTHLLETKEAIQKYILDFNITRQNINQYI